MTVHVLITNNIEIKYIKNCIYVPARNIVVSVPFLNLRSVKQYRNLKDSNVVLNMLQVNRCEINPLLQLHVIVVLCST
jgi:hypothetical protein